MPAMADATRARLAKLVLRYRARQGDAKLRRRLARTSLPAGEVETAFRLAAFLATRDLPAQADAPGISRATAAAGLTAWTLLVACLAGLKLWAGSGPAPSEPMPEALWVRDAIAQYKAPLLGRPALLEGLLPPQDEGNACARYLAAAAEIADEAPRVLRGGRAPDSAVADIERGFPIAGCSILGELSTPRTEDEWADLRLAIAVVDRLGDSFSLSARKRMAEGRFDLAQDDAIKELTFGRHLLEDWTGESQAAGLAHVERGIEALGKALAGRGRFDPETQVMLGRLLAEARAYAADPARLARIQGQARDPASLWPLRRVFDAPPTLRPYANAALSAVAMNWSRAEIEAGLPDPRRAVWLADVARSGDPRTAALAWAHLSRLARAERACRDLSLERRRTDCPAPGL